MNKIFTDVNGCEYEQVIDDELGAEEACERCCFYNEYYESGNCYDIMHGVLFDESLNIKCKPVGSYFRKLGKPDNKSCTFYVLNTKTGYTQYHHKSEESARTEAERLAQKQPGDIFRVLKVVGECTGKTNVEWKK